MTPAVMTFEFNALKLLVPEKTSILNTVLIYIDDYIGCILSYIINYKRHAKSIKIKISVFCTQLQNIFKINLIVIQCYIIKFLI